MESQRAGNDMGEHVWLGTEVGPTTYLDHQTIGPMDHKIVRWRELNQLYRQQKTP